MVSRQARLQAGELLFHPTLVEYSMPGEKHSHFAGEGELALEKKDGFDSPAVE
jgi:hypothetical protein